MCDIAVLCWQYCACFCSDGEAVIKHYHIKESPGPPQQFYLSEKYLFSSIPDLIEYHKHNAAGENYNAFS